MKDLDPEKFIILEKYILNIDNIEYEEINNKSIYTNKNLKWYDNSSGIGNFMAVIYYKLNLSCYNN